MIAITTRALTRRFNGVTAVNELSLKVEAGSLFGLIGPNGAGKTTTLRMLAGLLEPTSGEIRINELRIRDYWRELQWQIGYMPDFYGVYEDMLVWEYLDFFARCYRLAPERRKQVTEELLDLVDLTEKREAYVHTLSRGMRQRLCLAHALVHDPNILLLDEPASGLDPRARVEMRELLRELRNMGKTILVSSHILSELAELCDTVGIIDHGQLIASGSIEDIQKRISQHRRLVLRLLDNRTIAQEILYSHQHVSSVSVLSEEPFTAEVRFSGGDTDAANLLENLVDSGVRVALFGEANANLEDVFLQLTRGDES
ncbi:MAG: ABC transporter [Chloroflexi bacterium RBG_16_54_18]|nr:MAG: ABC transporter [Chloroflexi bacterium RBG_16_54_18]